MTYRSKTILLAAALLILGGLYFGADFFAPSPAAPRDLGVLVPPARFAGIARFDIRTVDGSSIVLVKGTSGAWSEDREGRSYPVDPRRIASLKDALAGAADYPEVSRRAASLGALSLDEASAGRLVALDSSGGRVLDLLIGDETPSGDSVYLRRWGSEAAFSGPAPLRRFVSDAPASWLDLKLFPPSYGEQDVERLLVSLPAPARGWELFRDASGTWRFRGAPGIEANRTAVAATLRSVLDSEAEDVVPGTSVAGVGGTRSLRLEFGDGGEATLRVGPADRQGRSLAALEGGQTVYLLSEWTLSRLFPDPSTLSAARR